MVDGRLFCATSGLVVSGALLYPFAYGRDMPQDAIVQENFIEIYFFKVKNLACYGSMPGIPAGQAHPASAAAGSSQEKAAVGNAGKGTGCVLEFIA